MEVNRHFPEHRHDYPVDRWSLRRYRLTLRFMEKHIRISSTVLDLGTVNGLSKAMEKAGYEVKNTQGEDLDNDYNQLPLYGPHNVVTAFEIFEHLMSPLEVLKRLPSERLVASIPLRLWFAKSFKNKTNPAGWHFHEAEQWQIDWLLEKAGWKILDREFHTAPSYKLGLRTLLRWVTPRFYFIYAVRIDQ